MPDHRLKRFRQRRDPGRIDLRDDDHHVAVPCRISRVLADDAEHLGGASSIALMRLGLTLRSASPPPTENIRIASSLSSRLVSSQAVNTLSQPSSLVRAVNSETLSIGL